MLRVSLHFCEPPEKTPALTSQVRQSNSRIIRWSDGTLSLRLGKELFDINQSRDTSGGIFRQSFGGPQASQNSVLSSPQPVAGKTQGLTYLVAQHKRSQVLQAEALVTGYMSICPTGMQSETHRMLVRAVGQKHNKVARLRMAPDPTTDPEKEKMDLMKLSAKKSKKRAEDDGFGGRRRRTASPRKRQGPTMWSDDEEEGHNYGASDEGEGSEGTPRKKRKSSGDEGKKGGEYQEDDFLVADSTDEEGGPEAVGKKNRKGPEQEMEEDILDKLDASIQEQLENRRRNRDSAEGITVTRDAEEVAETDKGGEEEMDVESEEDEDEPRVRRTGTSGRKKRAIDFEEEDDE
jgi:RNA polymerase-associated protein LEO1